MTSKGQFTGMTGLFLVAAELSRRRLIASPTSRNAQGADLLVTDAEGKRTFAVQVKTNASTFDFWLLNSNAKQLRSDTLIYALVNLRKDRTEYFLVPSRIVARHMRVSPPTTTRKSAWYSIYLDKVAQYRDNWRVFEARGLTANSRPTRSKLRAAQLER